MTGAQSGLQEGGEVSTGPEDEKGGKREERPKTILGLNVDI